jgi:hypothetical protein
MGGSIECSIAGFGISSRVQFICLRRRTEFSKMLLDRLNSSTHRGTPCIACAIDRWPMRRIHHVLYIPQDYCTGIKSNQKKTTDRSACQARPRRQQSDHHMPRNPVRESSVQTGAREGPRSMLLLLRSHAGSTKTTLDRTVSDETYVNMHAPYIEAYMYLGTLDAGSHSCVAASSPSIKDRRASP